VRAVKRGQTPFVVGKHYLEETRGQLNRSERTMPDCCVQGFEWDGTPVGRENKLADLDAYVTGSNGEVALLLIHDLFGWTFTNVRVLADQYAAEINATVYVPDL
jgi:membrane protein YdbS with pleckstrin-like domain